MAAGPVARSHRPHDNLGWLLVATGLLWLVKGFRLSTVPALFTVGAALTNMYIAVLTQLVFSFPWGAVAPPVGAVVRRRTLRVLRRRVRACVPRHPRISPADPPSLNLLLVRDDPRVYAALQVMFGAVGLALGVVLIGVVIARWRSGSPACRAAVAPLWIAALCYRVARAAVRNLDDRDRHRPAR